MDVVTIGDATLYHGDCMDVMPLLDGIDSVITDPPYGIGEHGGACRTRGAPGYAKHENLGWDNQRPSVVVFDEMRRLSERVVIWGGNYFADLLPPSMGWLYWRKLMGGDFSDGELAWTSKQMALREFTRCPKGMDKTHPCEKPVDLMAWCIAKMGVPEGATVCDPFMGSGTTGVACANLGRKFIGIEAQRKYFDIACERIAAAYAQGRLFA
jgi:DNA modification methylase